VLFEVTLYLSLRISSTGTVELYFLVEFLFYKFYFNSISSVSTLLIAVFTMGSQEPECSYFPREPIAIVGSSCRFPGGATSPSKLWELLEKPRDVLREIPASRFNTKAFYNPDSQHHGVRRSLPRTRA
jgi:Beta-ketoacyl synthase, N-terminal domain